MKRETKSEYSVREARGDDLETLPQVEHAAAQMFLDTVYPEIAAGQPSSVEDFRQWLDRSSLLVAVTALDTPVGFAIVYALDGDAYLHELDVHPEHGRRGVGRLLIEHVRSWAEQRAHVRVALSTFADVPWNAPYYSRVGFRELPEERAGAGLRDVRYREREAGLNVARRVFMVRPVGESK